ncbi:collagen alpha-1(I) chain-like [Psammomys obesus]|uniref:collagen alpha-1(I) chain-like n=1 Tax=Psammomys obesus TaxID=48139 RepID=UPI0024533FE1|nr:collagen alpha-1(I) chain-like [Psammomys obesus]
MVRVPAAAPGGRAARSSAAGLGFWKTKEHGVNPDCAQSGSPGAQTLLGQPGCWAAGLLGRGAARLRGGAAGCFHTWPPPRSHSTPGTGPCPSPPTPPETSNRDHSPNRDPGPDGGNPCVYRLKPPGGNKGRGSPQPSWLAGTRTPLGLRRPGSRTAPGSPLESGRRRGGLGVPSAGTRSRSEAAWRRSSRDPAARSGPCPPASPGPPNLLPRWLGLRCSRGAASARSTHAPCLWDAQRPPTPTPPAPPSRHRSGRHTRHSGQATAPKPPPPGRIHVESEVRPPVAAAPRPRADRTSRRGLRSGRRLARVPEPGTIAAGVGRGAAETRGPRLSQGSRESLDQHPGACPRRPQAEGGGEGRARTGGEQGGRSPGRAGARGGGGRYLWPRRPPRAAGCPAPGLGALPSPPHVPGAGSDALPAAAAAVSPLFTRTGARRPGTGIAGPSHVSRLPDPAREHPAGALSMFPGGGRGSERARPGRPSCS